MDSGDCSDGVLIQVGVAVDGTWHLSPRKYGLPANTM